MSAQQNKETVRTAIEEIWNKKNPDHAYKVGAPDMVVHAPHTSEPIHGVEGFIELVKTVQGSFPDYHVTFHGTIAEDEWVVARFQWTGTHQGPLMDIPPTGRRVTMDEVNVYRITAEGRVQELWANQNMMGMMQQLGLAPEGPPPKALLLVMRASKRLRSLLPRRGPDV